MDKSPKKTRDELLSQTVVKALESRHFEAYYCDNASEAITKVLELIPEGSSVSWGGSATFAQTGIASAIKSGKYTVLDRADAKTPEESIKIMKQALGVNYYIASANAISQDGILVNIDGNGNRVAAMCYGPDNVIIIAGMNKISPDLESAVKRARTYAAPINQLRFKKATPCSVSGSCQNCKSPDSICSQILITRLSKPAKRIKVILIGEEYGF